ncbi:dynein associated protein-domain-containing protein [Dioszegia hungarica]|uniref:Dynein associated protein-domain-containing protein n=1 Tax=Dioszegia hungarica TaxID=4972 RepID=A0AA38LPF9_9TREE|nr:dynein associated protein-domain-containing protein [Dioszegia hungarica]KAI9631947.1 dynein associated protein-domain-containing protein [Dioszegia hungarica]
MTTPEAPIGARVQVSSGIGHVRWSGTNPAFSAGKWVGVELLEAVGKNDGSVKGERYFDCQPNHGVFVRPSQVKVLEMPRPASTSMRPPPAPQASSSLSASTTTSRGPSPRKSSAPVRAGPSTPIRSTSMASTTTSSAAMSRKSSTPSAIPAPRPSSVASSIPRPPSVSEATPRPGVRAPSQASTHVDDDPSASRNVSPTPASASSSMPPPPPPPRSTVSPTPVSTDMASRPSHNRSFSSTMSIGGHSRESIPLRAPTPAEESASAAFVLKHELEELRIKVRILEGRKVEDQDRIRSLETKAAEADTLRSARVKLQAKFLEIQASLTSAQRQSKDLSSENTQLEAKATEAMDQLEMAALDREMAEEKAESAEAEVQKLNDKLAELEMEVALLKEENAEYEKPVSGLEGERTSLAYVQLEKHNERLKEALIRLRDVSTEAEKEYKSKIADMERELSGSEDLLSQLELAEAKLANAEAQVEDLKVQLDDALGAEDMLEQLTERNMQMSEHIEEMRATIEDLEALKELNDELEENHVEAEKQLNTEIDRISGQLRDERSRSAELDGMIYDLETTSAQFRELVTGLQSEIEELRLQQATQEHETAATSEQAQALMDLNIKLQSSATKAQGKTIEMDLRKLEAAQLAEQTRIITSYLPDAYHETDADSTILYLFFHRLSAKIDLLTNAIATIHNLPSALHMAESEALVGVCELRGKLRQFSNINARFAGIMQRSTPDEWVGYGKVLLEVTGVEGRVDGWIGSAKGDGFSEMNCARELASLIAQFEHLASTTFARPDLDIVEQQLGYAYNLEADLDNFAAAVGFARQAILSLTHDEDIEIETGESSLEEGVYAPVQMILDLVRSVRVPSTKLVSAVEDLSKQSLALVPDLIEALSDLAVSVSNAVDLAVQLAQMIGAHAASIRFSKQPLRLSDIDHFLLEVTAQSAAPKDLHPWDVIAAFISRLGAQLSSTLPRIRSASKSTPSAVILLSPPLPWLGRVETIKAAAQFNAETERNVLRLTEESKDMLREIRIRDQSLQEQGVKVEMLERRLEATRKLADTVLELENDVAKTRKQEKVYEDAIEQMQGELEAMEGENAKLRKSGEPKLTFSVNASSSSEPIIYAPSGAESSQLVEQIENLRNAIRYLRSENALLRSKDLFSALHSLPSLPYTPFIAPEPSVPELDPSTPDSPASSTSSLPETPTRHALETESKLLFREITAFQSSPRIVDISQLGADSTSGGWRSRKKSPEVQVWEWRKREKELGRRVEGFKERVRSLSVRTAVG